MFKWLKKVFCKAKKPEEKLGAREETSSAQEPKSPEQTPPKEGPASGSCGV